MQKRRQPSVRPFGKPDAGPPEIYGLHAVEAALRNPRRRIVKAWLTPNAQVRLADAIAARSLTPETVTPRALDQRLGEETVHQGALIEVEPLPEPTLAEIVAIAAQPRQGPLLVLDQVTDPHNVGAVLRSAAAFGASAVVMTRRHSPPLAGALAKAASGALEIVPVVLVQNLARALAELAEHHVVRVGLDGEAQMALHDADLTGPLALVLGAEGRGLRQLTRESCDRLVRIEAPGLLGSLNVSNAAAVALHFSALQRTRAV